MTSGFNEFLLDNKNNEPSCEQAEKTSKYIHLFLMIFPSNTQDKVRALINQFIEGEELSK